MPEFPPELARLTAFSPEQFWDRYGERITALGWSLTAALAILVITLFVSRRAGVWIRKASARGPHVDETFAAVLASTARYVLLALGGVLILQQFGVETASLVTVLGAATLAIGLALQGTLSNVAAGMLLLLLRPYRLGDLVVLNDTTGYVRDITLFTTELATFDNQRVTVPNGLAWSQRMTNINHHPTRRIDLLFRIAYEDDIPAAVEMLRGLVREEPRILDLPEPIIEMTDLGEHAANVTMWVWVETPNWFPVRVHLLREGLRRLRQAGYRTPYPAQREGELYRSTTPVGGDAAGP